MMDLQDKSTCPTLEEIGEYVRNPVFYAAVLRNQRHISM